MKKETKEIYGVIGNIDKYRPSSIDSMHYSVILTDEETGKEWEVIAPSTAIHWQFDNDDHKHYYVRGIQLDEKTILATYVDRWGRYCDHCGKHHVEGYFVGEWEYACSEECAIALYDGDENAFRADLALLDDDETADSAPTYWTEWE